MTTQTHDNTDARNRYVELMAHIHQSLDILNEYVEDHGGVGPDDVHWGHVGSAADIANRLAAIVNTL